MSPSRWAALFAFTNTNRRIMAPRPQQMQSKKERLNVVTLLPFIGITASNKLEFFSGRSYPD